MHSATTTGEKTLDFDRLEAEDTLVPCCHGFVAIDKKTQIIRLVHNSAQEYFDEQALSLFPNAQAEISNLPLFRLFQARSMCVHILRRLWDQ